MTTHFSTTHLIAFGALALLALGYFFGLLELSPALALAFAGTGGADAGSGGCASCSEGGCGGGSGGSGAGDSGTCGSSTTGCQNCTSSETASGDGSGFSGSTPYLFIQNEAGEYVAENDVMVGYPSTLKASKQVGEEQFDAGKLGFDTYLLPTHTRVSEAGEVSLQLRELEPEESYIKSLVLKRYAVPTGHEVLTNWDHQTAYTYSPELIHKLRYSAQDTSGQECSEDLQPEVAASVKLGVGSRVVVQSKIQPGTKTVHLRIRSVDRDWTPGESTAENSIPSPVSLGRKMASAVTGVGVALSTLFIGGGAGTADDSTELNAFSRLAKTYTVIPRALADTCNSLIIRYYDPLLGSYKQVAVVQPRAHKANDVLVTLPKEAVMFDGSINIEIYATKRHTLEAVSMFAGEVHELKPAEEATASMVTHRDHTGEEHALESNDELHLKPSERATLTFKLTSAVGDSDRLAVVVRGFYTPLSLEAKTEVSDWMSRLDETDRKMMQQKYPLRGYYELA